MNYGQLEAFVVLCETENITKTSEILYKTQPTISSRIKQLEDELGFLLIHRTKGKKSITITAKGYQFLHQAKKLLDIYREIDAEIDTLSHSLTISSIISLKIPIIVDICKKMIQQEHTHITLLTHQTDESYTMVAEKKIDVAFVSTNKKMRGVQCEPAFHQNLYVVRYCKNPEPMKMIYSHDLNPELEIYQSWGNDFELWHKAKFGTKEIKLQVDSCDVVKEFLYQSNYWTILQEKNIDELKKFMPLQVYELVDPPPPRITYMLTNSFPDKNNLSILKKFKQYVFSYAIENKLT